MCRPASGSASSTCATLRAPARTNSAIALLAALGAVLLVAALTPPLGPVRGVPDRARAVRGDGRAGGEQPRLEAALGNARLHAVVGLGAGAVGVAGAVLGRVAGAQRGGEDGARAYLVRRGAAPASGAAAGGASGARRGAGARRAGRPCARGRRRGLRRAPRLPRLRVPLDRRHRLGAGAGSARGQRASPIASGPSIWAPSRWSRRSASCSCATATA